MAYQGIVDLHCHLLPGIDDGAEDVETAVSVLVEMEKSGVDAVALTPHFHCGNQGLEDFLAKRDGAYLALCEGLSSCACAIRFKLGAEVLFSPELIKLDFKKLCLEGTPYLLVEFPVSHCPAWAKEVFYQLQLAGVIPVLAHAERYPYFVENPVRLYEFVEAGALVQINANSLLQEDRKGKMTRKFLRWNLVHVIASDVHSLTKRPFRLDKTLQLLQNENRENEVQMLLGNAENLFEGKEIVSVSTQKPRKLLSFWT